MNAQTTIRAHESRWATWATRAAIAVWAVVVCAGWVWMQQVEFEVNSPLACGYVSRWPAASPLERKPNQTTLVVFIHPRCPCTMASLTELERMFASLAGNPTGNPDTIVVCTVPATADDEWLATDSIERAKHFPGTRIFVDREGREAARFGATTSGMVMLFDAEGERLYAGGVTASRGHAGPNIGRETVAHILRGERSPIDEMPVFGCRLCLPPANQPNVPSDATNAMSYWLAAGAARPSSDTSRTTP